MNNQGPAQGEELEHKQEQNTTRARRKEESHGRYRRRPQYLDRDWASQSRRGNKCAPPEFFSFYRNRAGGSRRARVRGSVHVAPGGAENTLWNIYKRHLCLRRNYRHFFGSSISDASGFQTRRSEHQGVEALKKCLCPAAFASLWRQPSPFGDVPMDGEAGPTVRAQSKDAGRSQRETLTSFVSKPQAQDQREDEHRGHGQNTTK